MCFSIISLVHGSVLLRVAGKVAKRLEKQGNKGYSLGIWSWSRLLEGAESPNTVDFPKVVEQARWGGRCSWKGSPAGQLCSLLGLFCVVSQTWRWDCVASQASPEDQLCGMALLQDSRAPWGKGWEDLAWTGRECRHTRGRGCSQLLPLIPRLPNLPTLQQTGTNPRVRCGFPGGDGGGRIF